MDGYVYVTNIEEAFGVSITDLVKVNGSVVMMDINYIEAQARALKADGQDGDGFRETAYREAEHAIATAAEWLPREDGDEANEPSYEYKEMCTPMFSDAGPRGYHSVYVMASNGEAWADWNWYRPTPDDNELLLAVWPDDPHNAGALNYPDPAALEALIESDEFQELVALGEFDEARKRLKDLPVKYWEGVIEAEDHLLYADPAAFGITAETTDEEIEKIAAAEYKKALNEGWVVKGDMEEIMRRWRDEMREEESGEEGG